jgi:hypothetical protein
MLSQLEHEVRRRSSARFSSTVSPETVPCGGMASFGLLRLKISSATYTLDLHFKCILDHETVVFRANGKVGSIHAVLAVSRLLLHTTKLSLTLSS